MKLTRRQLGATVAPAILSGRTGDAARRPNILMILSDDHTAEFTGCYGNPAIRTPNLDRFAEQGVRLNSFFVASPQCVPSRVALVTGRSPVAVRMGRFSAPLPAEVRALPDYLREAGYFTGVCGRNYHLDGFPEGLVTFQPGGPKEGRVSGPIYRKHNLQTFRRRLDYVDISAPAYTLNRVETFFRHKPPDRPFFLWVNFSDPHHPWDTKAISPGHDPDRIPLPKYLPDLPGVRQDLARYYDEVGRMDGQFQQVLDFVESRGFKDNTLVIFLGDNGAAIPHGKGTLYDPGLQVPCLIRWPGRIRPGTVSNALASGEDLTPTLLEAAGLPVPGDMSGRSLLPVLTGRSGSVREFVFAARLTHGSRPFKEGTTTHTFDLSRMVRTDRYKVIYNCTPHMKYSPVDSYNERGWLDMVDAHLTGRLDPAYERAYFGPRPVLELYDLERDPAELSNLANRSEFAAVQRRLLEFMQEKMILDWDFLPLPLPE